MWEEKEDRGVDEKREAESGWCRTGWARVGGGETGCSAWMRAKMYFFVFFFFFLYIFPSSEPR